MKTIRMTSLTILAVIILFTSLIGYSHADSGGGGKAYHVVDTINDPSGNTVYDWIWPTDERESELNDYYYIVHMLTGWDVSLIEYLEKVSPGDLATMPPEMYEYFQNHDEQLFHSSSALFQHSGSFSNHETTWRREHSQHIWVSPEGNIYNGDLPPYQWLVWKGWEEYAVELPAPPEGAPIPAPEYKGTPRNTLPFAKTDPIITANIVTYYPIENPCPDAIYVNPMNMGDWDWTDEMKVHLANLDLDTDMGKTRLGYEKSGTTIMMVGMTPSGIMKEWTLKRSKGAWTCDSASAEELEDMLVILERIDAISGTALATPVTAVTEKNSLTSLKNLNLNTLSTNTLKGVNSSALQKSSILSGEFTLASISDRNELLSQSGTAMQQKSPVMPKAVRVSPKVRRVIGST